MKKTDLAYAAGIIDGEGCINIDKDHRGHYRLHVIVCTTDEWLVIWLKLGFGGCAWAVRKRRQWRWEICYRKGAAFLQLILPYLQLKGAQAELAIRFQLRKRIGAPTLDERARKLVLEQADAILLKKMHNTVWRQKYAKVKGMS